MRRITLGATEDDKKDEERKTQIETIQSYNNMLKNLQVNQKVLNANIHELF